MPKNTNRIWLGLILALAAGLRLWGLGSDELIFDEGLYAFRSIGYLDYLESPYQTTPVQLFALSGVEGLPWWTKLSFHDHPPLLFLVQHIFFKTFGDSLFAARLPSALAGMVSVYLIYLITKTLFLPRSDLGGFKGLTLLIPALIFAVSFAHVSVSRLAMMESLLFFLVLVNIYYFLRFLDNRRDWWKFGLTFGLALLTKYIAAILLPVYLIIWFLTKDRPSPKYWMGASMIALIIFSPVIIYNVLSYKTFGHFDLQLAYIFNQKTPWTGTGPTSSARGGLRGASTWGKNQEPFSIIAENFPLIFSWPLALAALGGLVLAISRIKKQPRNWLMVLFLIFMTLMLFFTGAAIRFTSLYAIPLAYFAGLAMAALYPALASKGGVYEKFFKKVLLILLLLIIGGNEGYKIYSQRPDYGVVKLDRYLDSVLGQGRSEVVPQHPNPHLNAVIQKNAAKIPVTIEPTGLIYDDNLATNPVLWLFTRRQYYHAIPVMTASKFQENLKTNPAMFNGLILYFIKAEPAAPLNPITRTDYAKQIEELLISRNQKPVIEITGSQNIPAFNVYKFSLK